MDYTIFQKFTLNSLFIFIVLYLSPTCVKANVNTQQTEEENISEIAITDINYSYELFNKSQSKFDCAGTLTCSISIPENAKELIFERTSPYQYNHNYIFFSSKTPYSIDGAPYINIEKENIHWNTYFRVRILFEDDSSIFSAIYFINDYIKPSDLEILTGASNIEDIESSPVSIHVRNRRLYIENYDTANITIYDGQGIFLFSKLITGNEEIPIDNIRSPYIILKYISPRNSLTKKILIK